MPAPTWAEVWTQLKHRVHLWQELYELGSVDGDNLEGIQDLLQAAAEGIYMDAALQHVSADRQKISDILSPANLSTGLRPFLRELMRVIGKPATTDAEMMHELRVYMEANDEDINARGITYGDPSAGGSNVGDGDIIRCTKDRWNFDLEATFMEAKRAEVVEDQGQRQKHDETFLFTGAETELDFLNVSGSGMSIPVKAINGRDTQRFLRNPSFETHSQTVDDTSPATTTEITGWTIGTAGNIKLRNTAALTYRGYPGEPSTLWAIEFDANDTLTQVLSANVNPKFSPSVPYYCHVAVQRLASATGNVVLHLGAKSTTQAIGSLTNDVWALVMIGPGDSNWYDEFREEALDVKVDVNTLAVGTVVVDDVILAPMTNVDGTFYACVGGATAFLREDVFTFTDALSGADSVLQYWFWRSGLGHLRHIGDTTETITDP